MSVTNFRRIIAIVCLVCGSHSAAASCHEKPDSYAALHYAPLIVTAPTSLVFSGVGYLVDGVVIIGGNIILAAAICAPFDIIFGGGKGDIMSHCVGSIKLPADSSPFGSSHIGTSIYQATRSWRCPI